MDEKLEPQEVGRIDCDRQLAVVRFSPSGKFLAAGGYDATVRRWDLQGESPKELDPIAGHQGWVSGLEFAGPESLVSVDTWGQLRAVKGLESNPAVAWSRPEAHDGWIRALSVRSDGKQAATGGRDRRLRIWNLHNGAPLGESAEHSEEVFAVAIHPSRPEAVSADLFGELQCWNTETMKCVSKQRIEKMHYYERLQDVAGVRILHFQDDETLICAGAEPQKTGRAIAIPTVHWLRWPSLEIIRTARFGPEKHGFVFDLARRPNGDWAMVTSGQPGNGQFILLRDGETEPAFVSTKLPNCHSVDTAQDGRLVVSASNRNSQGNGAVRDKEGNYVGNYSPLHLFATGGADSADHSG